MNSNDILDMVGDAKGIYVWDAQQIRSGATGTGVRKFPAKKMWLIAAILALLLVLAGCAVVYLLHMQDLKIGEYTVISTQQTSSESTEKELDVLSLQGIQDSSNYLANQEWLAFTESYVPELGEYWETDEQYWAYNVQNQVMVVRLKEANGRWWRTSATDHYAEFDTEITEAEAMEILNTYIPVTLDTRPLTEFEEP